MLARYCTLLVLCASAALAGAPAAAQTALEDLVQIDVLDGGVSESGTHVSALRLNLSPGWKTYWRAPGEAGIPPQFSWRGSRNVGEVRIIWPVPNVFDQNGVQSIGYDRQLVLPLEVTPAEPGRSVRLRGEVEIGLCKDVCIPATLSFDRKLDAESPRNPAIAAALAQRPYSEAEAGVRSATCVFTLTDSGMRVDAHIAMPSAGGREVAIIEPGNSQIWASEARTVRRGDLLIASSELVHVADGSYALDRSDIRITVLGQRHAVDIQGCLPG